MCVKRRFRDELGAKLALQEQSLNGHEKPKECVRYYPCKKCRGFHLTSKTEEEYRQNKNRRYYG